jgi:membrane fusion protein (multidrug efflux system)
VLFFSTVARNGLTNAAVSIGIALISIVLPSQAQSAKRSKIVAVEAITLVPTQLVEKISAIGTLRSNEAVIVRAEVTGRIIKIGFEEGQPVKKGTVLFGLDASVTSAELAEAKAKLVLSNRNYVRARDLQARGHGSVQTLDAALAQMRVDQARIQLAEARHSKTAIVAPFNGIVGLRPVSVGDYVEAGKDLVNLENIDPIKIEFHVPERYLRVVRRGSIVRISPDALPGKTFEGMVYAIDPRIDSAGRSISVRAKLPNRERMLRPGMFVLVRLVINRSERAIVVPEEAVVRRGDHHVVFRVINGIANPAKVILGLRQTGRVEIVDGLNAGDTVVTAGHAKLRNGSRVEISRPVNTPVVTPMAPPSGSPINARAGSKG